MFFQEWLKRFDAQMRAANRHILLLMDNAPSHITDECPTPNVEVCPLPRNTTSKIQPMDALIIAAFKRHYRRFHLQNALDRDEKNEVNLYKVDQLTAMRWCLASWNEISQQAIENCFCHTGMFEAVEDDRRAFLEEE